ncbi:MAG: hypothetical protein ACLRWH_02105 [Emergencia sp.]
MAYKKFNDLVEACKQNPHTKTVAVAGAADGHVLGAVTEAKKMGLVNPVLIGDTQAIEEGLKELNENRQIIRL